MVENIVQLETSGVAVSSNLTEHLQKDRYGNFWLTDAIRPSIKDQVIPQQGFRKDSYKDPNQQLKIPLLAAAVSRENLFDLFLDLLNPLGEVVDVVLETSHEVNGNQHQDLFREHIDLPVLQSHLCDYEELLLHDGCTGIAIMSTSQPVEVQFDEHKLLVIYGEDTSAFEEIFSAYRVPRNDRLKLITEGEHLHNTNSKLIGQFEQLCYRLGIGEFAEPVNW